MIRGREERLSFKSGTEVRYYLYAPEQETERDIDWSLPDPPHKLHAYSPNPLPYEFMRAHNAPSIYFKVWVDREEDTVRFEFPADQHLEVIPIKVTIGPGTVFTLRYKERTHGTETGGAGKTPVRQLITAAVRRLAVFLRPRAMPNAVGTP